MVGHSLMFGRELRLKTWLVDLIEAGKLWDVTDAPEEVDLSCDNNNENNDDDDNVTMAVVVVAAMVVY